MKKISLFIVLFFLVAFIPHKYYVSTSLYEFKEDKGSLQVTIKIFKDDFINAIKTNNGIDLYMKDDLNSEEIKFKINSYLLSNLSIFLDNKKYELFYLGLKKDTEMITCFLEIENLPDFKKIKLENTILFDLFENQKNIIHLKKGNKKRSFILGKDSPNSVLEF
ncbi:MAG: hypothetical protein P8O81_04935 [Flavobacteriaceae bacterium]|nr:hypothetical protein [Flavobacteriaceae bacterium]